MELLATVDWLIQQEGAAAQVEAIKVGLRNWRAGGPKAAARKQKLFNDRLIRLALERLASQPEYGHA